MVATSSSNNQMQSSSEVGVDLDQMTEIIKKQALIIEAAGIQFPTINQPIQVIYDTYLASTKQFDQIPTKLAAHQIPVTIKVI